MGDDSGSSHVDFVASGVAGADDDLAAVEEREIVQTRVGRALGRLDMRERYIIEQRIMSEKPMTLKELGEHFGFSRERARQLEIRAKEKLKSELEEVLQDILPPQAGTASWATAAHA
jgi:RNA polymerase sigma-32 factor